MRILMNSLFAVVDAPSRCSVRRDRLSLHTLTSGGTVRHREWIA